VEDYRARSLVKTEGAVASLGKILDFAASLCVVNDWITGRKQSLKIPGSEHYRAPYGDRFQSLSDAASEGRRLRKTTNLLDLLAILRPEIAPDCTAGRPRVQLITKSHNRDAIMLSSESTRSYFKNGSIRRRLAIGVF
jgi:hypothetical protein